MDLNAVYRRTIFWIKDFLKGSPIRKPYKEIKFIQEHSYEEGLPIREKALHNLMDYARTNSPFYKNVKGYDLRDFPILNKMAIIENYDNIKIPENLIPGQIGAVHVQATSGSTGTPFHMLQDTNKRNRRVAELKYFGKIVGFTTHEKLIHLRIWNKWQKKSPKQIKSENIEPFDMATFGEAELKKLCDQLVRSKAVCLRGYASSLEKLAGYVKESSYRFPHLKIAISGAEALSDSARALYKEAMNSEIISQYANEECGILAQERVPTQDKDNPMYINHSGYFFEVLKFDSDEPAEYGELGRIVLTDLYNYAFPIIRYDNGDVGILSKPDKFSNGYPVLSKLYGRRLDLTYTTSGEAVSPFVYTRILKHYPHIVQWQFVQETEKDYALKVVERDNQNNYSEIIADLKGTLGDDANINVEFVDDIPVLNSGKRKCVVNNWKKA